MKLKPLTLQKNKKGALTDLFLLMIMAFIFMIFIVVIIYAATTVRDQLKANVGVLDSVMGEEDNATQIIDNTIGGFIASTDTLKWITVMLFVGMVMSILITSYLIRTKPIFFIPYILITIIAIIVSAILSNIYAEIYANPTLSSTFQGFWGMTFIFANLPTWITAIGFIAGLVMFINMIKTNNMGMYG